MKNIRIILFLALFVIMVMLVVAFVNNEFTDGITAENLTYTGADSKYKNISINKDANITNATLTLRGYNKSNVEEQVVTICNNCGDNVFVDGKWKIIEVNFSKISNIHRIEYIEFTVFILDNTGSNQIRGITKDSSLNTLHTTAFQTTSSSGSQGFTFIINTGDELPDNIKYVGFEVAGNVGDNEVSEAWGNDVGSSSGTIFDNVVAKIGSGTTADNTYTNGNWLDVIILDPDGIGLQLTISYFPTNVSVKVDNSMAYENLSKFNISLTIDLNKTALQSCVDTCSNPSENVCLCEVNFTSGTVGVLEISNLNITWDDIKSPTWTNNQTNITSNTKLNDVGQFNVTLTDNSNLSSAIFSWNVSGFWINLTQINFTTTTTNITIIENRTINQTTEKHKAWTVYFNDSTGNTNQTDIFTFNIKNQLPIVASATINNSEPIDADDLQCDNGSISDADSDTVTLLYNWTKDSIDQAISTKTLSNSLTSAGDIWVCRITPFDGFENGTTKTSSSVSIDTGFVAPIINETNSTPLTAELLKGEFLNLSVNFTDTSENGIDNHTAYFCKTDSADTDGCSEDTFCSSNINVSASGFLSCRINITNSSDFPLGITTFYTFVVDNTSLISASKSNTFTIQDITPPTFPFFSLQFTNLNDASGNTNEFNVSVQDNVSNIKTISFLLNGTLNVSISFTFTANLTVNASYKIFETSEALNKGFYNITQVTVTDNSSNSGIFNFTNITFTVSAEPSSGGITGGGGGGGGTIIILGKANTTFDLLTENFGQEYKTITAFSDSVIQVAILIENLGNKTTTITLKCVESSNITASKSLCDNAQFQDKQLLLIPSSIPSETSITVRFPKAELFETFSLIVEGTSEEGGLDNLRMTFVILPRISDSFAIVSQMILGVTRLGFLGDFPYPNVATLIILESIILLIFIPREFEGKVITIILLTILILLISGTLAFLPCGLESITCTSII